MAGGEGMCVQAQPLAEHICADDVTAARKYFELRRNPEGLLRSAWNTVEYAINQQIPICPEVRSYDLEHAQGLINMLLNEPKAHQDVRLGALVLSTYIPLFKKRSVEIDSDSKDCEEVYKSLGAAMRYLQPLSIDQPPQWRMTESAVLALSARTKRPELLLYPTSPREENSLNQSLNHDSYFIGDRQKIPIQQKLIKTSKTYDDWITILTLQQLVEGGLKKSCIDDMTDLSEQMNYLLSLIIAETNGETMSTSEATFLNHVSTAVVAHRWKREKSIKVA